MKNGNLLVVAILLASTLGTGCATTSDKVDLTSVLARLDAAEERVDRAEEARRTAEERAGSYEEIFDQYVDMTPEELDARLRAEERAESAEADRDEALAIAGAALEEAEAAHATASATPTAPVPLSGGAGLPVGGGGSSVLIPSGSAPMYVGYLPPHLSRKDVMCVTNYSTSDPYWILPIPSGELPPVAYNPQGYMPTPVSIKGMSSTLWLIPPGQEGCFEPSGQYSSVEIAYFDGPLLGEKRLVGVMSRDGKAMSDPWGARLSAPGPGSRSGGSFDRVAGFLLSIQAPGVSIAAR